MYYRQPKYFGDFRCIGGDCRFSCCAGWMITWKENEINKVKNAPDCSEELRALLDSSFKKCNDNDTEYYISLGEGKRCPFLTEENLCKIQKELGAEYLSNTCSEYPRNLCQVQDSRTGEPAYCYRSCCLSCPEITKRLVLDRKAMELVNIPLKRDQKYTGHTADRNRIKKGRLEYCFRGELFELFYGLISDKKNAVEISIAYGVLAAGLLTAIINEKDYENIPQAISELRNGPEKNQLIKQIKAINPNYQMKVDFLGSVLDNIVGESTVGILKKEDGTLDVERYKKGEQQITQMFGGDEYWLRNIALNLLFEFEIPFYSEKYSILESYSLFLIAFACIKLNAVASVAGDNNKVDLTLSDNYNAQFEGMDSIWGFASVVSRNLCQNTLKADALIRLLKTSKIVSPMMLATLIK